MRAAAVITATGATTAIGSAFLPWVWVGPFYVTGIQGPGVVAAMLVAPALVAAVRCMNKLSLRCGWLVLLSGASAFALCAANLATVLVRSLLHLTIGATVQLAAALSEGASGAAHAAHGAVLFPADVFLLALTSDAYIPAVVDGSHRAISSAQSVVDTFRNLDVLEKVPRTGIGLVFCTAAALLTALAGWFTISSCKGRRPKDRFQPRS